MTTLLHRSRRLLLLLAVGLGVTVTLTTTTPASAQLDPPAERARNHYGAIALSIGDGGGGLANDARTMRKAKKQAMAQCKRRSNSPGKCEIGVAVRNACGAISVRRNSDGSIRGYGWAKRPFKGPAIRAAHNECKKAWGKKCRKYAYVCTTRHF